MDGIVIINKEKDYTSHDVVAIVKKTLKEKVGHTGTLDPEATGVLPLLIGKATKISKYSPPQIFDYVRDNSRDFFLCRNDSKVLKFGAYPRTL